ncbi:MAG: retropepsin-like aspartic protease [Candidatus Hadarchaeales archaeon]
MRGEQARGKIKLNGEEFEALFDTEAPRSVIPKEVALRLGEYIELPEGKKYELRTAKGAKVRIIGICHAVPEIAGYKAPITPFEVSEDVKEIIIGIAQLCEWDIIFTPEGPRPKGPIRLRI